MPHGTIGMGGQRLGIEFRDSRSRLVSLEVCQVQIFANVFALMSRAFLFLYLYFWSLNAVHVAMWAFSVG